MLENEKSLACNPKISSGADRNYFIEKLQPGTIYIVTVTVKAFTSAGYGPEDKKESETVKSGKLPAFIYNPVRNCWTFFYAEL